MSQHIHLYTQIHKHILKNQVVDIPLDQETKSNAYYNLGNAFFKKQEMEKSIESYKNSLRLNPSDPSTKKNLALAQRIVKQQQQQQQQQQQDQNQENQKQEEKENPNQQQQQQQQQGQQPPEEAEEKEKEKEKEQQEEKDLNKEEAMELLKIMDEEERKVQEKLRKAKSSNEKPIKDW